ncbi:MAG: prepilin-type N-terminal cleavage/methylation domain-containing protein [Candidatus Paceibacterota bacterium]|jgi:prepilin-type N-terminal cleavage/methylation domain-containing protein
MEKKIFAFTLIELLVVIAIIGILSGLIIVSLNGANASAQDARTRAGVDSLRKTILAYGIHSGGVYPAENCVITSSSCPALTSALVPDYYSALPDTSYSYTSGGTDFTVSGTLSNSDIYSYTASTGFSTGSSWSCGNTVTFTYKGSSVTYGTVSHNSRCWLDRNLGASGVGVAGSGSGDLFQWGRLDDGHQTRTSSTTTTLSSADVPGNNNFILTSADPNDWRSPQNNSLWQGVSGINNPCPSGWRIATQAEWETERLSWSSNDYNGALASPLQLTMGGYRTFNVGNISNVGNAAMYWSSTINSINPVNLNFYTGAWVTSNVRAYGFLVRCILN